MKKVFAFLTFFTISSAYSADIQLRDITSQQVNDLTKEFGVNFSHTAIAAPETDGLWGVEVGIAGGTTQSPNFSDIVDASGGKGSELKNLFNVGGIARIHVPFEIFVEATLLPEQKVSDIKLHSSSYAIGWNFGRVIGLPLDLAAGYNYGSGELSFHQDAQGIEPAADVKLTANTSVYWLGISKSFWIFTPYFKLGTSNISGNLDASIDIYDYTNEKKQSTDSSGSYFAGGINLELGIFKVGIESSKTQDVKRVSGKLSLDF